MSGQSPPQEDSHPRLQNILLIDSITQNTRYRLFANTEGAEDFLEDVVVVDGTDDYA